MRPLAVLLPGPVDTPTGGFVYDRHALAGCETVGLSPSVLIASGDYPNPRAKDVERAARKLDRLPDGTVLVVDGLCLAPLDAILDGHADRLRQIALIHHPIADETGLSDADRDRWLDREAGALARARLVVATSRTTARRLTGALAVPEARIRCIPPGVGPRLDLSFRDAPRPPGPLRLLSVGTLIPRKGHDALVDALCRLGGLDWQLDIVGAPRDPAYAGSLAERVGSRGLDGRIRLRGAVAPDILDDVYRTADLFVLASRHEGFGIAYQEAVRWGLPVLGTTAGAIPEAVPEGAGVLVPPDDVAALAEALERLIVDDRERAMLIDGAVAAAASLRRWPEVGAEIAALLRAEMETDGDE